MYIISVSQKLMHPIQFQSHLIVLELPSSIFQSKVEKQL
jgi:hypothetical protein